MTLSQALAAHIAAVLGVDIADVFVGVSAKGEIVAKIRGERQWSRSGPRIPCFLERVPADYDPIAAGDGEWGMFPP